MEKRSIRLVIETVRHTAGAADWTGIHLCDYGACTGTSNTSGVLPLSDMSGKENRFVPSDSIPIIYACNEAAKEIGCKVEVIDFSQISLLQKLEMKIRSLPIPRIEVNKEILAGNPTKADVIEFYHNAIATPENATSLDSITWRSLERSKQEKLVRE